MSKIIPSKNEREEGGKKLTLISPDKKTEEKKEENLFKKEGPKIVYKNVDVSDLSSIFNEGILSMDDSENNNWEDGKRAENRTDVVYTFSPKGNENSFTNYGVALLEIEQEEKKKNKFESDDVQAENYDEYISEGISPDKIKKVYLPKIFKGKLEPRLKEDVKNKVEWVDIKAKHWDSEKGEIVDAPQIVMNQFANTASFEDSSELNYFRGKYDNGDVFDLKNIEYVIEKETRGEDKQKRKERRDKGNKRGSNFDKKAEEIDNGIGMQEPPTEKANRMEFFNENPDTAANIGEDVLGAKRHNFDTYSVEQLEREGLAHKVINKKFLYGDINSEAETKIENGETFEKIAVVYAIKKTLKAKVEDDESKRALFVDLSRIIEEANTATEQADTFLENTRIKMGFARARDWSFEASKKNREAANKWEETVGKRTMSILLGKKRIKSSIRDKQELINELRKFGYKKEDDIKVKKGDLVKVKNFNSDKFKKGFKSPKALYENREEIGIMVRRLNGERDRDKWREMYKEYNKLTGLEKYSPVEEEHKVTKVSKGKYHVVMKYKIPGRTGENIQRVEYSVPIEDLELISSNKSERKKKAEPKIILEGKVERVGGKKVSEDRLKNQKVLKDNFGMRGLQYGNSMTNEEIDYHTQRTVEAFLDMGEVIGLPAEDLSMKGRLAMAYGARGSGGAIAHYEPSQKIINLTRGNGFGSLAHEWFHFVDNVISNVDLDKKGGGMVTEGDFKVVKSKVFSSESLKHGDIINVRGLRTYVYNKDGYNKYYALGVNAMEPSEWKLKTGTDMNIPESTFSSGMISTEKNEDSVGQKASEIATFLEKKMEEPLSQYSNYWKRRREIMARAFESYVADKLEDKKQKNTYLTSVSKTGSSDVYPQGETRKEANKMFDELFRMMGEQGTLKKAFDFYFNSAKNTTRTIEDANKKSPNSKLIFKSGK